MADTWTTPREALRVVARPVYLRRTGAIALGVGTILFAINQLDVVLRGEATKGVWLKSALTYLVPFCVSNTGILVATRGRARAAPAWCVSGSYFESCNCDAVCPCRQVGGRPGGRSSYGICQFALSWRIDEGRFGDVPLDGREVVLAGWYDDDEPGSPWRVMLYVDEDADDSSFDALSDIFLGRAGGTARRNYAAAIGEVHAVRRARIALSHVTHDRSITVDELVRVRAVEDVRTDETVSCGIPGHDRPGQEMVAQVMAVTDPPLRWDVTGRCAFAGDFEYAST
jgi:hypothetical protein